MFQLLKQYLLLNVVFFSFVKKVRMGKRIEKAFTRDKNPSSASHHDLDDDPNRTPGNLPDSDSGSVFRDVSFSRNVVVLSSN